MHVCIDYRPALHESTGVGTYVRGLLRALAARFPDDSYTAFSASIRHRLSLPAGLERVRPRDARLPVRALDWMWHRHHWPPLELLVGPIDIAHSPSPMLLPTRRARQIVTVHDCYFLRHPEDVMGPIRRDYVPLARAAVAQAAAVLTVSETTKREVVELMQAPPEKVHVTPLAVEAGLRPAAPPDAAARAALGLPGRYLLFVGRREPRKDLPTLLEAFARVVREEPEVGLVLVGPPGLRWTETWEAAPAAARAATVQLPHRSSGVLGNVYAGAEALLLPSRWEGFGLTALEAMAVGTPVIAARAGALPETLGEAAEWVEPGDVEGLARACLQLLGSPARAAALAAAGHEQARRFCWRASAEATRRAYTWVLGA